MIPQSGPRPSDKYIPWYIVLFFVVQGAMFAWFYYLAHATYTGLVTDQAYEKGLQYNQTISRYDAQQKLGWSTAVAVKNNGVEAILTDANKNPLAGARALLWLVRPVHAGIDRKLDMTETSPGRYFIAVTPPEKGLWEARISVEKDGQSFQTSQRIQFQ